MTHIDVECRGCKARYRVAARLAGRVAECKHCGQKFMVPYKSAVVRLGEEDDVAEVGVPSPAAPAKAPAQVRAARGTGGGGNAVPRPKPEPIPDKMDDTAGLGRDFSEYGQSLRPKTQEDLEAEAAAVPDTHVGPILPAVVSDVWLPLGLAVVCYGIALYMLVTRTLASNGVLAGLVLIAIMAGLFIVVVMPLTMRMLEGASKTVDVELPNAAYLQALGAFAVPTLAMVIGYFAGGTAGLIAGGAVGIALAAVLLALMFGQDLLKGVQAALLGALFYGMGVGGAFAVLALVAFVLMPVWKLNRPWDPPKPTEEEVRLAAAEEARKKAEAAAPPVVAPAPKPAPQPVKPVEEAPKWTFAADPAPPVEWPAQVRHTLVGKPPLSLVHAAPAGPAIAVRGAEAADVYDLRTGKKTGSVAVPQEARAVLPSPDGEWLLVRRTGGREATAALEVWSVADARKVGQVASEPGHEPLDPLGFVGDAKFVAFSLHAGKPLLQVWDLATVTLAATLEQRPGPEAVLSPGGRYLATPSQQSKVTLIKLDEGKAIGELPMPEQASGIRVLALAFAPDGERLAAVVSDGAPAQRLLVWDLNEPKLTDDVRLPGGSRPDLAKDGVRWVPGWDAIALGSEIVDTATGKPLPGPRPPALPPGSAANAPPPRLRHVLSPAAVLFEMPPPPNTGNQVTYVAAGLPTTELASAVKPLRDEGWTPPELPDAPPPTGDDASPASASDLPPEKALAKLAAQREWVVTVVSVARPDTSKHDAEIEQLKRELPALDREADQAKSRADTLASQYDMIKQPDGSTKRKRRHSDREIGQAKVAASRAQDAVRDTKASILRLEREKAALATAVTIAATAEDGTPTTIPCDKPPLVAVATSPKMTPGSRWRVAGAGKAIESTLTIQPRTLAPVDE